MSKICKVEELTGDMLQKMPCMHGKSTVSKLVFRAVERRDEITPNGIKSPSDKAVIAIWKKIQEEVRKIFELELEALTHPEEIRQAFVDMTRRVALPP